MESRPVGKTRDVGWQIGVSRTLDADVDTVWSYLISEGGLAVWLGTGVTTPLTKGRQYETDDGTTGQIRTVRDGDRVRLTWQPPGRPDPATVQVAVAPARRGCLVRFHTEKLYDGEERERMREHWRRVMDNIERELSS